MTAKDKSKMKIIDLAIEILREHGKPMHYRDIFKEMRRFKHFKGKTPEKSVYSVLTRASELTRVEKGVFELKDGKE